MLPSLRCCAMGPKQWIARQTTDIFVKKAHRQLLRSRASFKLLNLLETYPHLIKKGASVLDLGAAPGGWSQVAVEATGPSGIKNLLLGKQFGHIDSDNEFDKLTNPSTNQSTVVAVDLLHIDPIPGAEILLGDMTNPAMISRILECNRSNRFDVVLSDMAHSFTGTKTADGVRVTDLCRAAFSVAQQVLKPRGNFVCKFIRGDEEDLHTLLQSHFSSVQMNKPKGSRAESPEAYYICTEYIPPSHARDDGIALQPDFLHPRVIPRTTKKSIHSGTRKPTLPPIPHWSRLTRGTRVKCVLVSALSGKPVGKGVRNGVGKGVEVIEGIVDALVGREYHPDGCKVRLDDGRIVRVREILED